jgi:hypothetical protein
MFCSVVLPEPDRPTSATRWPRLIVSETPRRAWTGTPPPKVRVTPLTLTMTDESRVALAWARRIPSDGARMIAGLAAYMAPSDARAGRTCHADAPHCRSWRGMYSQLAIEQATTSSYESVGVPSAIIRRAVDSADGRCRPHDQGGSVPRFTAQLQAASTGRVAGRRALDCPRRDGMRPAAPVTGRAQRVGIAAGLAEPEHPNQSKGPADTGPDLRRLAPAIGLEPITCRLTAGRSAD